MYEPLLRAAASWPVTPLPAGQRAAAHAGAQRFEVGQDKLDLEMHDRLFAAAASAWGQALRQAASGPRRHALFDATPSRAKQLFQFVISNPDAAAAEAEQRLVSEGFRRALRAEGFQVSEPEGNATTEVRARDDGLLRDLFQALVGEDVSLDAAGFHFALQRLKLHTLLGAKQGHRSTWGCCLDWSPSALQSAVVTAGDLGNHLLTPRAAHLPNRWCHYNHPDDRLLLELGVKHGLHIHALNFCKECDLFRVWVRGGDHHAVVPLLRLTKASVRMLHQYNQEKRLPGRDAQQGEGRSAQIRVVPEVEEAKLYLFLSGSFDEVFTTLSPWASSPLSSSTCHHSKRPHRLRQRRLHAEDQHQLTVAPDVEPPRPQVAKDVAECAAIFSGVVEELGHDYSELRLGEGTLLVFVIWKTIVQNHLLIYEAYRARLDWFEQHRDEDTDHDLAQMFRELGHHSRHLESLAASISKMANHECFSGDIQYHMSGLGDNIAQLSNQISERRELCQSLRDENAAQRQAKNDDANMKISLMVALILPFQLLTGVYGMNFLNDEGKGMIPFMGQLTAENSYFMFWGLGSLLTALMVCFFRHIGFISLARSAVY